MYSNFEYIRVWAKNLSPMAIGCTTRPGSKKHEFPQSVSVLVGLLHQFDEELLESERRRALQMRNVPGRSIPYGAGTRPWGSSDPVQVPRSGPGAEGDCDGGADDGSDRGSYQRSDPDPGSDPG